MLDESGVRIGLALAAGLLTLAYAFAWKQKADRQARAGEDLSSEDASYFARRDVRRTAGTIILALIGFGMLAGSMLHPRRQGMLFIGTWLAVGGLVCVSLVLALIDWGANRGFALRHRRMLIEERRALIEAELRRRLGRMRDDNGEAAP